VECELAFPCTLPLDSLGIGYGSDYFSKIHAGRNSTFTTDYMFNSEKNGCISHCLGMGEIYMARLLEISPFVLAYRCQYPMLLSGARDRIDEYASGLVDIKPKIRQRDLISLDFLVTARRDLSRQSGLTLKDPDYIALSHKLKEDLKSEKVKNRLTTEGSEAKLAGFKYQVFSRNRVLDECGKSAKQISLWGKGLDFNKASPAAIEIARGFYQTYAGEVLDNWLSKVAKSLRMSVDQIYQYFSAAINLGFLCINLSLPVRSKYPLQLIQPSDAVPPWISFSGKVNSCTGP
jgi:hypothetical protein